MRRQPRERILTARIQVYVLFVAAAALSVSLVSLTGCAGSRPSTPDIRQYALFYEPPALSLPRLEAILAVAPFSASPEYDGTRIVYQERDFTLGEYAYHRWRAAPSQLATNHLLRDLRAGGLFSGVVPADSMVRPTHLLEGNVDEFLERKGKDGVSAVLEMTVCLSEAKRNGTVILQKSYRAAVPAGAKNPRALAEAMSSAMAEVSRRIGEDVHAAIALRANIPG
jgi:ABC-type uncharacterized transport system auxiliary subunit